MLKSKYMILVALCGAAMLTGCNDELTDREQACLDNGGTWDTCTYEGRKHAERMALAESGVNPDRSYNNYNYDYDTVDYPPVEPHHNYTNYYGDPRYGAWSNGVYHFNDPYSSYAIQTNSYLLSAGLNGLAAYVGTKAALKSSWTSANPNGYHPSTNSAKTYIGKGGKIISHDEAMRRSVQSARDSKAHAQKLKQQLKQEKAKAAKLKQQNKFLKQKKSASVTKPYQGYKSKFPAPKKTYNKPVVKRYKKRAAKKRNK